MSAPNICRRCKKKRSPEETPETLKYRTCKPCREIERKKKRLKKLEKLGGVAQAENTVGGSNVMTGPGPVADDQVQLTVSDARQESLNAKIINIANQASMHSQQQTYERQTPQQSQHLQHQQHQHQHQEHKPEVEKEIPIDESLLKEGQSAEESTTLPPIRSENIQIHQQQPQQAGEQQNDAGEIDAQDNKSKSDFSNDTKNIFAALQNAEKLINSSDNTSTSTNTTNESKPNADYCLYCGILRDVNDNGRYKLCGNCVENPSESNVVSDFDEYLNRIENGKCFDIKNLIFLKKFNDNYQDIEKLPILKISQDDNTNNLDLIMESLSKKFIQPIIAASGFKFSKGSSNLSSKPFPKAIKVLYKCKQDVKTTQRSSSSTNHNLNINTDQHQQSQSSSSPTSMSVNNRKMKTEDCNSNMYVSYDLYGRTLNIKYNHNSHKTYLEKLYSDELINEVKRLLKFFGREDLESIFDRLSSPSYSTSERVKMEIADIKKPKFTRDFANLI